MSLNDHKEEAIKQAKQHFGDVIQSQTQTIAVMQGQINSLTSDNEKLILKNAELVKKVDAGELIIKTTHQINYIDKNGEHIKFGHICTACANDIEKEILKKLSEFLNQRKKHGLSC